MAEEQRNAAHKPPPERLHLFDAATYTPDTIDLSADPEACQYWLTCFRQLIGKFAAQAAAVDEPDSVGRAEAYRLEYVEWLESLSVVADDYDNNRATDSNDKETTTSANSR